MNYRRTPIHEIQAHPVVKQAGVRLLVKREDLNDPDVSGNKWWKLKDNLAAARTAGASTVLTFGGAYSNHIYATAAACARYNLKCIGFIRGEETKPLNPTLRFAADHGMELHYITRSAYREKANPKFIRQLHDRFGDFHLLPEGGSNELAVRSCAGFAVQELQHVDFDHMVLAVGTGGTMAGIVCGLRDERKVIGVPVLRNGGFLADDIRRMVAACTQKQYGAWSLLTTYHHGGYARSTPELLHFMREMQFNHGLPLDRIYTAKAFHAVISELAKGSFRRGDTILFLHTGGLQAEMNR